MGYKIKVDHSKLESAAKEIDTYNQKMTSKMGKADKAVTNMMSTWKGNDAKAFKTKWDTVNDKDSTYGMMKKSLDNYSKYLKDASSKYKKAQADAINRANMLPRW